MKMNRTLQRQAIREELCKLTCHPTAEELYGIVRERVPQISLGTVYRNLEQLSECGMIRKLEVAGKQRRFDGNIEPHHHLRCRICGGVSDLLPSPTLNKVDSALQEAMKAINCENVSIEFQGVCQNCK